MRVKCHGCRKPIRFYQSIHLFVGKPFRMFHMSCKWAYIEGRNDEALKAKLAREGE